MKSLRVSEIFNLNKNTLLADKVITADTSIKRIIGLLRRKDFKTKEALIIKPCKQIHTFFMRFPIDVLFLDKNYIVIGALPSLKPFRLTRIYFNAALSIELPAGTLESSSTREGDTLLFRDTL